MLLLGGCSLNSVMGMDCLLSKAKEPKRGESNIITPYVTAGVSFAVARYAPEIAESTLAYAAPHNPLAHALVPAAIKYGGYGLGAHLILKNACGINYSDFAKADYLKKVARNTAKIAPLALCHPEVVKTTTEYGSQLASCISQGAAATISSPHMKPVMIATGALTAACLVNPNLAPATLCHPEVARLAADCCTHFASSYLNDSQLKIFDIYAVPAIMTAGAVGTLYLLNKSGFKARMLKTAKKLYKDIRPYSFLAPLAVTYNADTIKNHITASAFSGDGRSNIQSDIGTGIKAGLYWGGVGLASYLFLTQTLDVPTQGYVKSKIDKLVRLCTQVKDRLTNLQSRAATLAQESENVRNAQVEQEKQLNEFTQEAVEKLNTHATLLGQTEGYQKRAAQLLGDLKRMNTNLQNEARNVSTIAQEVLTMLDGIAREQKDNFEKLKTSMTDHNKDVIQIINKNAIEVTAQIAEIQNICKDEIEKLNQLEPRLENLLKLIQKGNLLCTAESDLIAQIAGDSQETSRMLDSVLHRLVLMQEASETPGRP